MRTRGKRKKSPSRPTAKKQTPAKKPKILDKKNPFIALSPAYIEILEKEENFVYLASKHPYDHPENVFVDRVDLIKGYGLYAAKTIYANTILGEYTGEEVSLENLDTDSPYSMFISDDLYRDAKKTGNFTRFANCSEYQDNACFEFNEKLNIILVMAKRTIKAGEQILIKYTEDNLLDKEYYCLHPSDSWKSSVDYRDDHVSHYQLIDLKSDYPGLALKCNDQVYLSKMGHAILNNEVLTDKMLPDENSSQIVNLRFLKQHEHENVPLGFDKFDSLNALMLACYFGQVGNVKWLIKNKAEINKQQTISGKTALFFAFQGLKDNMCSEENCTTITILLCSHHANPCISSKISEIFLFDAMRQLNSNNLALILKNLNNEGFEDAMRHVNEDNLDLVFFAIKLKRFDILDLLLSRCGNYFNQNIDQPIREIINLDDDDNEEEPFYNLNDINESIVNNNYMDSDRKNLRAILKKHHVYNSVLESIPNLKLRNTSADYLHEHFTNYKLCPVAANFPTLYLGNNDQLYLTDVGLTIMNGGILSNELLANDQVVNLYFLKKNENSQNTPLAFDEFNAFNALMLACYLGQCANLIWLLKKNADLNMRQLNSGRSALFFAVQGFREGICTEQVCMAILITFIKRNADIFIKDNMGETFLYEAIKISHAVYMPALSAHCIFEILREIGSDNCKRLLKNKNHENLDAVLFAIKYKNFAILEILLQFDKNYFEDCNCDTIVKLIEYFTESEKNILRLILQKNHFPDNTIQAIFKTNQQAQETHPARLFTPVVAPASQSATTISMSDQQNTETAPHGTLKF